MSEQNVSSRLPRFEFWQVLVILRALCGADVGASSASGRAQACQSRVSPHQDSGAVEAAPSGDTGMSRVQAVPELLLAIRRGVASQDGDPGLKSRIRAYDALDELARRLG